MTDKARVAAVALMSFAGIALAHALVYLVAPGGHAASEALAASGHSPWIVHREIVAVAAIVALLGYVLTQPGRERPLRGLAPGLAAAQVGGFLVVEAAERLAAGVSVATLLLEPVILVGMLLQVLVAIAAAVLLAAATQIAAQLRPARLRRRTCRAVAARPAARRWTPALRLGRGPLTFRGPPVTA